MEIQRYPEDAVNAPQSGLSRIIPKPRTSPTKPHPLVIREGVDGDTSPSAVQTSPQTAKHMPTRSAPALPTLKSGSRSTSHIGSVPQPLPRKPRPRHTSVDGASSPCLNASSSSSSLLESELEVRHSCEEISILKFLKHFFISFDDLKSLP